MVNYVITAANSVFSSTAGAFVSVVAKSTLTVQANAELICYGGGDGADITDFTNVSINGEIFDSSTNDDGLVAALANTISTLSVHVGATGYVVGNYDGLMSFQSESINNSGSIQADVYAAIQEDLSHPGSNVLANAKGALLMGNDYGLYENGNNDGVTESVTNSGVIRSHAYAAIALLNNQSDSIANLTGGTIAGSVGVNDEGTIGAEKLSNAGLIEGDDNYAILFSSIAGSISVTNAASGRIVGDGGVVDQYSNATLKIVNAGVINGGSDDGIYVIDNDKAIGAQVSNAVNAEITGDLDGGFFQNLSGSMTIGNSGLISGHSDDGLAFSDVDAVTILNAASGVIRGGQYGLYAPDSNDSNTTRSVRIVNAGLIAGTSQNGVYLQPIDGGAVVMNSATGTITGGSSAVLIDSDGPITISNAGAIFGQIFVNGTGEFTFSNTATGKVVGDESGISFAGGTGARTLTNYGFIRGAAGYGIVDGGYGSTTFIYNKSGGQIYGGGVAGIGIFDYDYSGKVQTIVNAGTITGQADAVVITGNDTGNAIFANSGIVNGNVQLGGAVTVKIVGGVVHGKIDMSLSDQSDHFTMAGGTIDGMVEFGSGADNLATIGAGATGVKFECGANQMTFAYEAASASRGTTSATQDSILDWNSDNIIDLSAFAANKSFTDISQNTSLGYDVVSLNGSQFSVSLTGVTTKLTASNFVF